MPVHLPPLATIKARALKALNENRLQCQQSRFKLLEGCTYSGPCAVGAALQPNQIRALQSLRMDDAGIASLIDNKVVRIHPDDSDDARDFLRALQDAHDEGNIEELRELLETP